MLLGRPAGALALFDGALASTTVPSAHAVLDKRDSYGIAGVTSWIRRAGMTFPKPWATLRPMIELDERLTLAR